MLNLQSNRRLSEFSTFGIGGPIHLFAEISTIEEMEEAFQLNIPFMILGKGSNCLFSDEGFDGLVLLNKIDFCEWKNDQVTVGAGYSFSLLGAQTARKGFSGLEFASGIPATVGGAVYMNAGANGHETCECLISVQYLHSDGTKQDYSREELKFAYRHSPFQRMDGAILSATFVLKPDGKARTNQLKIVDHRMKTQPLKEKSAGCVFRNPFSKSAGALIDACGLKGMQIGGAKISEIHANFIVNVAEATSEDVQNLIVLVQKRVLEQTGVHLEPEIRIYES